MRKRCNGDLRLVLGLTVGCGCAVEAIFAALCECASKHPDPEQEDDEGDFFFDEDEVRARPAGRA